MLKTFFAIAAAAGVAAVPAPSKAPVIPAAQAARIFARARALCQADGGRLWGVSLCVPMMLADPQTRAAVLDAAAPGAVADGKIFRLALPAAIPIANAPVEYGGSRWAQILWPPYGDEETQAVTLMHESFHAVQPKLGFSGYSGEGSISGDASLDTQAGRIWLRGELHALRAALQSKGDARRRALRDAIALRFYRDRLFPGTAEEEREQNVMEGLAESTGIDAGLPPNRRIGYALHDIAFVESQPSYARAFPYATGPAYSELLDAASAHWRRTVKASSNIAQMAMRKYRLKVTAPSASQAQTIIARYGGGAIESQEAARAARKAALDAKYTRELVAGPTLTLPMTGFHITFNPRDVEALSPYGSVYHTLTVTAPWGTIAVSGGDAMISKDFRSLAVAAPSVLRGKTVQGPGWKLNLTDGYAIVPNPQKSGSYTITH